MGGDRSGRRRHAFGSLAGNMALLRVLAAYLLFILTEYGEPRRSIRQRRAGGAGVRECS